MSLTNRPSTSSRRLGWLLALALLVAQSLALWHESTHGLNRTHTSSHEQPGLHAQLCGLCIVGATVTGPGAASTPFSLKFEPAALVAVTQVQAPQPDSTPIRPYQSRAPPVFLI